MDDRELKAGEAVSHYRILSLLGAGGMGRVYLADDTKLHRKVSLKFLSSSFTEETQRVRRFEQEARAASALNHPNILTIHEIGETDGRRFIATEYIEGQTLRDRLRSPLNIDDALEIAIQVASALVAAHKANIVHRDIKPENIMIRAEDGLVKVLDFGLAKTLEERAEVKAMKVDIEASTQFRTAPGVVMGTLAYMSPEQARGETVDERTDIWSLGVVIYEMVAGSSPFAAGTANEIISSILSKQEAPRLSRYSRLVPQRLEEFVEKALTKNRDERYQTTRDLLVDLKRLKQSSETRPIQGADHNVSQVKSHKQRLVGASIVLLLIVAGALFYAWRLRQTNGSGEPPIRSIAVLPLANTSSDADTDFISDGITDNIIVRLSQVSGLRVTAHTAVFRYKGRDADPRTIGSELSVEAILTGRVVKRGEQLTIRLELVDARDNRHLWGEQYERKLSDILGLQREIPLDVSDKLRLRLSGESKERLTRAYTDNTEAYQLYLKGRYSWEKWTQDGARQAVDYFEEAISKDPDYALAYSGLADAHLFGLGTGLPLKESRRRAREGATKAISIDPQLGEAHAALAVVLLYDDWDVVGSEREFKRAIELSPSYAEGHHQYSHLLLMLGRNDESLAECRKFLELDPISESPIGHLGYYYLYTRHFDEAIREFQKALRLYPDTLWHTRLGHAYYAKGMEREAVEEYLKGFAQEGSKPDKIARLREAYDRSGIKGFHRERLEQLKAGLQKDDDFIAIVEAHSLLGEKDQAFEWLEKAYTEHARGMMHLKENVLLDNLRADPRYAELVRRVGLPK